MHVELVVAEERHEAFYLLHTRANLNAAPHRYFYFSHFSNLGTPKLFTPLEKLSSDPKLLWKFTHTELNIDNFLLPLAYLGIIEKLYWFNPDSKHQFSQKLSISSLNSGNTILSCSPETEIETDLHKKLFLSSGDIEASYLIDECNDVLHIDYDYFLERSFFRPEHSELEISEEEFEKLQNPFHFLRLRRGGNISSFKEAGKYFLKFKPLRATIPSDSLNRLEQRAKDLLRFLAQNVKPALIILSRSTHSGLVPRQHRDAIESRILGPLLELFGAKLLRLSETEVANEH